jgi:hypothetical protein
VLGLVAGQPDQPGRWWVAGAVGGREHHEEGVATRNLGEVTVVMRGRPRARRLLPTRQWSPGDGSTLPANWEPLPPRANDRRSRRPCHYSAIHSGHCRSLADYHGQRHSDLDLLRSLRRR